MLFNRTPKQAPTKQAPAIGRKLQRMPRADLDELAIGFGLDPSSYSRKGDLAADIELQMKEARSPTAEPVSDGKLKPPVPYVDAHQLGDLVDVDEADDG